MGCQFLENRQFPIQLQFRIFDLKKLDRLEIIATFPILPRLQTLDQHRFHRRNHDAGLHL